jgi:hypothetical protein
MGFEPDLRGGPYSKGGANILSHAVDREIYAVAFWPVRGLTQNWGTRTPRHHYAQHMDNYLKLHVVYRLLRATRPNADGG